MKNNNENWVSLKEILAKSKTFDLYLNIDNRVSLNNFRDFLINNIEPRTHYDLLLSHKGEFLQANGITIDRGAFMIKNLDNLEITEMYLKLISAIIRLDLINSIEVIQISFL